jgi:ElaB/YqjD/DUF883 family membrane-anchored ribosome-binding protein
MTQNAQPSSRAAADLKDMTADQFKRVADGVEGAANKAAEHVRGATDAAGEVAGNIKSAVSRSVKDQPMATLAAAAAVGFVLGALWKS